MADSENDRSPQTASRIDLDGEYEVQYWTERLNVSAVELREAVQAVGASLAEVEAFLDKISYSN